MPEPIVTDCSWCKKPINHQPGDPYYFADQGWDEPLCYACWYEEFGSDTAAETEEAP
jgi:hypothetical protein